MTVSCARSVASEEVQRVLGVVSKVASYGFLKLPVESSSQSSENFASCRLIDTGVGIQLVAEPTLLQVMANVFRIPVW